MIRVIAFARVRELLGFSEREFGLAEVPTVGALRAQLERDVPALLPLRESTRIARNGQIVDDGVPLAEGDEVALLPPVGGG
ncbi:MAG TPA: MoaD/ThiS family protein [Candidatus Baltobacteraceae bacterium]|jgi:molybdopterin converting factor subunit 1